MEIFKYKVTAKFHLIRNKFEVVDRIIFKDIERGSKERRAILDVETALKQYNAKLLESIKSIQG